MDFRSVFLSVMIIADAKKRQITHASTLDSCLWTDNVNGFPFSRISISDKGPCWGYEQAKL